MFKHVILRALVFIEDIFNYQYHGQPTSDFFPAICPVNTFSLGPFTNHTNGSHYNNESLVPWTYKPKCIRAADDPSIEFCVYTKADYGDHGISIITKSKTMAESVNSCQRSQQSILTEPKPHTKPQPFTQPKPYKIVDLEDKGRGIVATRLIRAHEVIMVDHVALLLDGAFADYMTEKQGYDLLDLAANQLPRPEVILGLSRGGPDVPKSHPVFDVMTMNSFGGVNLSIPNAALFPDISRTNHHCKPNSHMILANGELTAIIRSYRDIPEGEEITINYLPEGLQRKYRHAMLEGWGFECKCSMCEASAAEIAASDDRRTRIDDLDIDAEMASKENKTELAIQLTEESIELLREEDLMMLTPERYESLISLNTMLGRWDEAEKYRDMMIQKRRELEWVEY
ncbi:uncharacterized protein CTRU02_213074 [Colletotrichum truncatum]|uniref:Uncharacterized protein n=1 Tax=Colletotrichum truncatum TaxID=5467 RepID=A0ACC3YK91_COLTU|nr:uncharacterized protein CTRU02_03396 [Colletotrichum truncatum]KAF6797365.1 hypothetical protein CTRU02_03396 [Colletotrichum truncatum]